MESIIITGIICITVIFVVFTFCIFFSEPISNYINAKADEIRKENNS